VVVTGISIGIKQTTDVCMDAHRSIDAAIHNRLARSQAPPTAPQAGPREETVYRGRQVCFAGHLPRVQGSGPRRASPLRLTASPF
jgi:hypothetical protein